MAGAADELPDDLLREATQRLGILAMVWAGLFVIGLVLNHLVAPLLDMDMHDLIPWGRAADIGRRDQHRGLVLALAVHPAAVPATRGWRSTSRWGTRSCWRWASGS